MERKLILILLLLPFLGISQTGLATYKNEFKESYSVQDSTTMYSYSLYNCGNNIFDQKIYYVGWRWSGNLMYWRATGEKKYLDELLVTVYNMVNKAITLPNGYLGWPGDNDCAAPIAAPNGYALWESFSFRRVTALLRIMHNSPILRNTAHSQGSALPGTTYQDVYNDLLPWIETNIWDKWEADTSSGTEWALYRGNVHMASHWMAIGLDLYVCTGTAKYLTVFNNISKDGFPAYTGDSGANLRNQIEFDATFTDSYQWFVDWNTKATYQDTDHAGDVVQNIWEAYQTGIEENITFEFTQSDMIAFARGLDNLVWANNNAPVQAYANVDGSGAVTTGNDGGAKMYGWWPLIGIDATLRDRVQNNISARENFDLAIDTEHLGSIVWGLTDYEGTIQYPENYYGTPPGAGPGIGIKAKKNTPGVSY